MRVRIMPLALREIEAIGDHIARDSPARAVSFVAELYDACSGLSEHPERFPFARRYETFGIRRRLHGACLIFHRIASGGVEVLRVVHGARDLTKLEFD